VWNNAQRQLCPNKAGINFRDLDRENDAALAQYTDVSSEYESIELAKRPIGLK